ncbi:MAG TPA: SPOR domain-containing protein [Burkholderiaceae bacterium]|nr:SPOR domain-containing protein [Burkholderiaceae bacterium]
MDLLSAFKRKKPAAAEGADSVLLARTRARQRLIGAAVLVAAGIIGFPLLFESEPRPLPVDVPIQIQAMEGEVAPTPQAPPVAQANSKPAPRPVPAHESVIDETAADAGREVEPPPASAPAAALPASKAAAAKDEALVKQPAAAPPAAAARDVSAAQADAARAKALLEGKPVAAADAPPSAAGAARFVVQVGAFTDPAAVKSTRAKVERLGLTTYTQVAQTSAGERTRVRVGPFATRAEAERAAARIKAADLPTVILAL